MSYDGNNPTALQSKMCLVETFVMMMKTIPYNDINIKELCCKAGLSRQTFYNLFDRKEDILRFYVSSISKDLFSDIEQKDTWDILPISCVFIGGVEKYADVLKILIINHLEYFLYDLVQELVQRLAQKVKPEEKYLKYGISFLSGAVTHLLICWITDDNRITQEELAQMISDILTGSFYNLKNI